MVKISEEQFEFMKGRSTTDPIFALRQLQYERDRRSYTVSSSTWRRPMTEYQALLVYGQERSSREIYQPSIYMYHQSETVVKCAVGTSNSFTVEVGLHLCSALSPFLSAIIMDVPTEDVRKSAPWQMLFAEC